MLTKTQKVTTDLEKQETLEAVKNNLSQATLKVSKVLEISETEKQQLFDIFNKFKFVILECDPVPNCQDNLLGLKIFFGSVKKHKRSEKNGIVIVKNLGKLIDGNDQISTTNLEHLMHTDGSFDVSPPKVVALQCEIPSQRGGLSQIVYGESVYEYLIKNYPQELEHLFTTPLTITRGCETATRTMFLEKEGRILITFRSDSVISTAVPPILEKAISVIRDYVNNPEHQIIFKLQAHQILLLDNTSVLHGRTSFPDNEVRKLNRLWFDGISEYSEHLQFGFVPKSKMTV